MNLKPLLAKGEKLNWRTPKRLFQKLNEEFNFMLDAATSDDNPLNTPYFYTEKDDALTKEWINPTYVNPPYSSKHIIPWLQKGHEESKRGITSVYLLPSRTSTRWMHDYVYGYSYVEVRYLRGRLQFEGATNSAPFDSIIVVLRGKDYYSS